MNKILATLDCETDPFKVGRVPQPFIWGLYWADGFATFNKAADLVAYIRKSPFLIFAHNGGKFDFMFLLDHLDPGTELHLIDGRLAQFKLGHSVLRDSYCLFPMGLAKYKKDEINYSKFEAPVRAKHWDEIIKYLRSDCEYLYELVSQFRENYGKKLTLAGSALAFWREHCGREAPKTTRAYYDTYRPYYFGGMVRCFQKGVHQTPINSYDINSAYPFAMLHPHPWGQDPIETEHLPDSNINLCMITLEAPSLGLWPWREEVGQASTYPDDGIVRTFNITGWEFMTAKDLHPNLACKILTVHKFKESITFEDYVQHFYTIKKASAKNSFEYLTAKLFMNSLYGKWAANPAEYKRFMVVPPHEIPYWEETTEWTNCDLIHPWALMQAPLPEQSQHYYDVALGASITGFVRAYMTAHLARAKNVFYVDTDCIHCESLDCSQGTELGEWTHEFSAVKAGYAGKKLYALQDAAGKTKTASKGVRLNADQIFEVAGGKTILWKNEAPTFSVKGGARFIERKVRLTS